MNVIKRFLQDLKDAPKLRREIRELELSMRFSNARVEMLERFGLVYNILSLQQKEIETLKKQIKKYGDSNNV
jgi:hypothetical protein